MGNTLKNKSKTLTGTEQIYEKLLKSLATRKIKIKIISSNYKDWLKIRTPDKTEC